MQLQNEDMLMQNEEITEEKKCAAKLSSQMLLQQFKFSSQFGQLQIPAYYHTTTTNRER